MIISLFIIHYSVFSIHYHGRLTNSAIRVAATQKPM